MAFEVSSVPLLLRIVADWMRSVRRRLSLRAGAKETGRALRAISAGQLFGFTMSIDPFKGNIVRLAAKRANAVFA
jgi:hypothetical protein